MSKKSKENYNVAAEMKGSTYSPRTDWTLNMMSVFLQDVLHHYYGVDSFCQRGVADGGLPAFQFNYDSNTQNKTRFNLFLNDINNFPAAKNTMIDKKNSIIIFQSMITGINFLWQLSKKQGWDIHLPINEVVSLETVEQDQIEYDLNSPQFIAHLKRDFYTSAAEFSEELLAVKACKNAGKPHVNFTYTIDEIIRSSNTVLVMIGDRPADMDPTRNLWFH